ncbi:MAG: TIGR03086 family metal-binding protein, partial [Candidatus Nanopelagicales bacterium]
MLDLDPAASEVTRLLDGVTDDRLAAPTPCVGMSVAALLDHFVNLSLAFTAGARKTSESSPPPPPSAEHLPQDWRSALPRHLGDLVNAWRDPAAWQGTTEVAGATTPAKMMGAFALDELVMHGWDLARATGQTFSYDPASTEAVLALTSAMALPENA